MLTPRLSLRRYGAGALLAAVVAAGATAAPASAITPALTSVDLTTYVQQARYDLPEPTRTTAPQGNLLAQEASGVTYNWDTGTLFVVGDGGTSVTQVSTTGQLIDTMTLAAGSSPAGTEFYDTEGITYIGGGQFVMTEERDRRLVKFTYAAGTTLTRAQTKTVTLGTNVGNVGLEGVTNDPTTGGFIAVKEKDPESIFQTTIDWEAGTASNGSPSTTASTDLFPPASAGLSDFSDVYALSNVSTLTGADASHLLMLSQESGKVINVDRSGNVSSSLTLQNWAGAPNSIQDQTHEGVTLGPDGTLYIVSEEGGGDFNHPQLWVYAPSTAANTAPTSVALTALTTELPENSSTATRVKVANVTVGDDGLGTNDLAVTGADAADFEVDATGLYLKAGTTLSAATKSSYTVSVTVDDTTVGSTPDATSSPYTLTITPVATTAGAKLVISEASPWSSGNSDYAADWFELTNAGTTSVDLTGWKMDDSSNLWANAAPLSGVTHLAPGESAVFLEAGSGVDTAALINAFTAVWWPGGVPSGLKIGTYTGSGVGLSTGGDGVNVFNAAEEHVAGIAFPAATVGTTFDNTAGAGSGAGTPPTVSTLSADGVNGAFTVTGASSNPAGTEIGSPGTDPIATPVAVTEVAPWGSSDSTYAGDWFEVTNTTAEAISLDGWKVDDSSHDYAKALALSGVSTLAAGQSAIFIETGDASTAAATTAAFTSAWFGSSIPAGFQIGTYHGSGIGLSTGGDEVNLYNAAGDRITGVAFGTSSTSLPLASFDNAAGAGSFTLPLPVLSTLSQVGVHGAFIAHDQIGSPGTITTAAIGPRLTPSAAPTFPAQPAGTIGLGQWITLANTGDADVTISRLRIQETDAASAGDFLLAVDRCTTEVLYPGDECKVMIRFAPGRADATSSASLLVSSNVAGDPLAVALSGASTGLPAGPKGDTGAKGDAGPKGDTGAAGPQGPAGAKGDDGVAGPAGPQGPAGPAGPAGPVGPAGPAGPAGPQGPAGADGKDGTIVFAARAARLSAIRGRSVRLRFTLENQLDVTLRNATAKVRLPAALGGKTRTIRVKSLGAGKDRTLSLVVRIARTAPTGTYAVRTRLTVGGQSVTRTVRVTVRASR